MKYTCEWNKQPETVTIHVEAPATDDIKRNIAVLMTRFAHEIDTALLEDTQEWKEMLLDHADGASMSDDVRAAIESATKLEFWEHQQPDWPDQSGEWEIVREE
jgi:hypothetical protein